MITREQLIAIMPLAKGRADAFLQPLNDAMAEFGIDSTGRVSAFLANVAHETGQLRRMRENMNYSASRLLVVFDKFFTPALAADYAGHPERIAARVYANRNGNGDEASRDGWKYIARGGLGLTFADNYSACSSHLYGDSDILLAHPELLEMPVTAMRSAAWFWWANDINRYADADDFDGVCDSISRGRKTAKIGDANGYADRVAYFERAKLVLK